MTLIISCTADDLSRYDLSCYGYHPYIKTPNLDNLAAAGAKFLNHNAVSGSCGPNRMAKWTGMFPSPYGALHVSGIEEWIDNVPNDIKQNLPIKQLQNIHGVRVAGFGKWHLGAIRPTDLPFDPIQYGLESFTTTSKNPGSTAAERVYGAAVSWIDSVLSTNPNVDILADLNFHDPHSPLAPSQAQLDAYNDLPSTVNPYGAVKYWAAVTELDRVIGLLRARYPSAIIIFTSDNGPQHIGVDDSAGNTGPLSGRKKTSKQGGLAVPLIVNGQGIDAREVSIATYHVDLPMTIYELFTGGQVDEPVEGRVLVGESLAPILLGTVGESSLLRRERIKMSNHSPAGLDGTGVDHLGYLLSAGDKSLPFAIVDWPWKLFSNLAGSKVALYNLDNDPAEIEPLAGYEFIKYSLISELMRWVGSWYDKVGRPPVYYE